jgi:hypothetical protein
MMSRGGSKGGEARGASLQGSETDKKEKACARAVAQALQIGIDRKVIRFCFGEGVDPLARFTIPDLDEEDAGAVRDSAGFLADRGVKVSKASIADRLGIELAKDDDDALESIAQAAVEQAGGAGGMDAQTVAKDAANMDAKTQLKGDYSANARAAALAGSRDASLADDAAQKLIAQAMPKIAKGVSADMKPVLDRIAALDSLPDDKFETEFPRFLADLPQLSHQVFSSSNAADEFHQALLQSIVLGFAQKPTVNARQARSREGAFKRPQDVHLKTGRCIDGSESTITEAAHLRPGDRVHVNDTPITVKRVSREEDESGETLHIHGVDDAGQATHHQFK